MHRGGFHAIMVVRDEGDIIPQTIAHILGWCDSLSVFDTGSDDATWDIVQAAARADRRVACIGQQPMVYTNALRAWLFQQVRRRFHPGDWIVRADADEFYHVNPREFVSTRLARHETRIGTRHYDFFLTDSEVAAWDRGEETPADRARPIELRRRCWQPNPWVELRLFQYRRSIKWCPSRYNPSSAGLVARHRIPVRHYQSRDPEQLRTRCRIRREVHERGHYCGSHWALEDWRWWVVRDNAPGLRRWHHGEALPEAHTTGHVSWGPIRLAQRAFYGSGFVRLTDSLRPGWRADSLREGLPVLPATYTEKLSPNSAASSIG